MQVRRQMIVEVAVDPPSRSWWQACVAGEFFLQRFDVVPRNGGPAVASATFRDMSLGDGSCGADQVVGLIDLVVEDCSAAAA